MKTCLNCMVTTLDDSKVKCELCGSEKFRSGRPKSGYKMEQDELDKRKKETKESLEIPLDNIDDSTGESSISDSGEVSVTKWVVAFIIMSIPIVNVIFAIVTIVRKAENDSYINYMKAALITNIASYIAGLIAAGFMSDLMTSLMYTLY